MLEEPRVMQGRLFLSRLPSAKPGSIADGPCQGWRGIAAAVVRRHLLIPDRRKPGRCTAKRSVQSPPLRKPF